MKKLNELRDEEVMNLYAWMLDFGESALEDPEIREYFAKDKRSAADHVRVIGVLLNKYKKKILELLAIFNGVTVDELHYGVFDLPKVLISIMKDEGLWDFFGLLQTLKGSMESLNSFGFATENTEGQ